MSSAVPRAPPASPAAGWIQMFSNGPSRRSLPLATQLSATPPAMQRFFMPVCSWMCRPIFITMSSVTFWIEAAMSMCSWSSLPSAGRAGRPNSWWNFSDVIVRPWQ